MAFKTLQLELRLSFKYRQYFEKYKYLEHVPASAVKYESTNNLQVHPQATKVHSADPDSGDISGQSCVIMVLG